MTLKSMCCACSLAKGAYSIMITASTQDRSSDLFYRAQRVIAGGVNSPVRAFRAVGGEPRFIHHAQGAYLYDEDEQRYVDYVGSWGPMILGHSHPVVVEALQHALQHGTSFGAPCAAEVEMAELICEMLPMAEQVRMVNSGTEATMSAIRLARGVTGRHKIIKFIGCYHGHSDALLVEAGSGALTFGVPSSAGVPPNATADTLLAHYNDLDSVQQLFDAYGDTIAAVIVEPIPGNMNLVLPTPGFLSGLRQCCNQYNALLIFDEVMSGFRVGPQGAQGLYGITPDLTTLGKIIGGGLPVGAFVGSAELMNQLSPTGPVYQAGTLSGNPLAMTAGLATLRILQQEPELYEKLAENTTYFVSGLIQRAKAHGIPFTAHEVPGMFGVFFTEQSAVANYAAVMACHKEQFNRFFHGLLARGVYLAPSPFEAGFISLAHTRDDLDHTLAMVDAVFSRFQID